MKKMIAMLLTAALGFSLTACGNVVNESKKRNPSAEESTQVQGQAAETGDLLQQEAALDGMVDAADGAAASNMDIAAM